MKQSLFFVVLVFLSGFAKSQTTYKFNGNGNWSDTSNWENRMVPPSSLPDSVQIFIDPIMQGECVLNVPQTVRSGSQITVVSGKKFKVPGEIVVLNNTKGEVFINAFDPRLAEITTDDSVRITFFGDRDSTGVPLRLSGYSIASLSDSTKFDYVSLDDSSRYSNILLRTGEKMHFDYEQHDTVAVTITGLDSVSHLFKVKRDSTRGYVLYNRNSPNNERLLSSTDRRVNIKVVKKNTITQVEELVTGDNTVVMILFDGYPYRITAKYDNTTGLYYVKHSEVGIEYNEPSAIRTTIELIKGALEIGCYTVDGDLTPRNISILQAIMGSTCAIPLPATEAICVGTSLVFFACNLSKPLELLNKAIYKINIDPAFTRHSGNIKAASAHYKLGTTLSENHDLFEIYNNQDEYDFKLTHEYAETPLPTLSTYFNQEITSNSAVSGGLVSTEGASPIIIRGVCWSTAHNPTVANPKTIDGNGIGSFTSNISGLTSNVTY